MPFWNVCQHDKSAHAAFETNKNRNRRFYYRQLPLFPFPFGIDDDFRLFFYFIDLCKVHSKTV